MFPIPFNMPYRKPDGTLTTIGEVIASGGGGGGGTDGVYVGETDPDNEVGEDGDFYLKVRKEYVMFPLIPAQVNNNNMIFSNDWAGSNGQAWHLCDGVNTTFWSTEEGNNTNQYCGYDFGENGAAIATRAGINVRRYGINNQLHDFKIQGSNDNETWVDLYNGSIANDAENAGVMLYFDFDNTTAYRYYRLFAVNANDSRTITVFELQLYAPDPMSEPNNIVVTGRYIKSSGAWSSL